MQMKIASSREKGLKMAFSVEAIKYRSACMKTVSVFA